MYQCAGLVLIAFTAENPLSTSTFEHGYYKLKFTTSLKKSSKKGHRSGEMFTDYSQNMVGS